MAIDIREDVTTAQQTELIELIEKSIYVTVEDWEVSHRECEVILHIDALEEDGESISLHVAVDGYRIGSEWLIANTNIKQIDHFDADGLIESHQYRGFANLGERKELEQSAAETLLEIVLETDERLRDNIIASLKDKWAPLTQADYL